MREIFHKIAHRISEAVGSSYAFILALILILIWASIGPAAGYTDTWQLVINTSTTILTFLMVFLIQNTQNRDAKAIHLKLDELIRSIKNARSNLIDLEDMTDKELDGLQQEFEKLRESSNLQTKRK